MNLDTLAAQIETLYRLHVTSALEKFGVVTLDDTGTLHTQRPN